jgi:hypothetical protein
MSYLYSKLPETGVSPHIGTGGTHQLTHGILTQFDVVALVSPPSYLLPLSL